MGVLHLALALIVAAGAPIRERPNFGLKTLHQSGEPGLLLTPKLLKREPRYEALKGLSRFDEHTLFGKGPHPDDVLQGTLGDCYFLATVSSLARANPDLIKGLFARNDDGTLALDSAGRVQAMFYREDDYGDFVRDLAPITTKIPVDRKGRPIFARVADQKLWVVALEKAFAVWNDKFYGTSQRLEIEPSRYERWRTGWDRIDGGHAWRVMEALTGIWASHHTIEATRESAFVTYTRIQRALAEGRLVDASSVSMRALKLHERVQSARATRLLRNNGSLRIANDLITGGHAYSVFGAYERHGQRYVLLRNPFGERHRKSPESEGATFELPLEKFTLLFNWLDVSGQLNHSTPPSAGEGQGGGN